MELDHCLSYKQSSAYVSSRVDYFNEGKKIVHAAHLDGIFAMFLTVVWWDQVYDMMKNCIFGFSLAILWKDNSDIIVYSVLSETLNCF